MWKDLRHALRTLPRNTTTTVIIVLTLALCIGANTAIFSVVDAMLLRPLPYPEPDRLAQIATYYRGPGEDGYNLRQTGRSWENIRDHATFLDAAAYSDNASGVNFSSAGNVEYVRQQRVGAGFFHVLGVEPLIGREFTPAEDHPGGPPLAVLSYGLWKRVFHEDSTAVGKTLMLRGEPYTVIGIMPENFHTNSPADLWTPVRPTTTGEGSGTNYAVAARLKAGITWPQAEAQIESVGAALLQAKRQSETSSRLRLVTLQQGEAADARRPVLVLWAAVGLVLLIGCANVASLLLARAAARGREIATRIALGGGRAAIIRQSLIETAVLAIAGGAAGLLVARYGLEGLKALAAKSYGVVESARLDGRVLVASVVIAILASLLAGIVPALEAGSVDIRTALSEAGGRGVAGGRRRWSRRILVGGEIAIAVLLLIGAGLLIRTVGHFYQLRPGFDPSHVITASFSLQDARYGTARRANQLFEAGLARVRAIPGIESAGAGLSLPYETALNMSFQRADGPAAGDKYLLTNYCYITPGYLETLRIPVLRGRAIRAADSAGSSLVIVVNEAFAKEYMSRQDPLGSHLKFGDKETREVVGIVGDVPQAAGFGEYGPLGSIPAVYVPAAQMNDSLLRLVHTWYPPNWVIRSAGAPADAIPAIQNVARTIDPLIPIAEFRTIDQLRSVTLASQRFQASLLAALSGSALALAIVGIYGLMSQSVVERRRELGIRMALGATIVQAIREAIVPGIALTLAGVAVGCLLAGLSAKVLQHLIWGVSATDPATYAATAIGLILVAMIASLLPALRITRLNPADTLRDE